ncbi:MAG: hypothetical protein ABSG97_03390 [Sedimentisphaerales bacterium]
MIKKKNKKPQSMPDAGRDDLITVEARNRLDILTGVVLLAFGVYHSVLYFGHTAVPISDFPDFYRVGKEILSLQMPSNFKMAPVVGILQNLLTYVSWGSPPELTAGWLLNAILHPFTVVLLWLVGKRIIGRSAVWFAVIVSINPWTIYYMTEPIVETTYLFFILLTLYLIFRRSRWAYLVASVATMVRYEAAALIFGAFVADIIHRKDRRDVIMASVCLVLASLPLAIWLILTAVTWKGGGSHYFNVFFSKEYAKGFVESVNRTGILLHIQLLWQVAFLPLFTPYPGASAEFVDVLSKLTILACIVGLVSGCIFSIIRRRWEVLMMFLFFVPYFVLHAYYPYPWTRFHSTIFWIALLVAWFGLQSIGGFLAQKARLPWQATLVLKIGVTIAAGLWFAGLARSFGEAAKFSPDSASIPYVAMLVGGIIIASRAIVEHPIQVSRHLCAASMLCLVIASNQFVLVRLVGDSKREIEFKMLGEWFAANGKPDEKLAVYQNDTRLFAGKNAPNVVGFPKADTPEELVEKLRQQGITYVVWATREGYSHGQHTGYQQLGLNKTIAFLNKPHNIGCYEFVRQLGSERGFVNIFRLKNRGEEQLPRVEN